MSEQNTERTSDRAMALGLLKKLNGPTLWFFFISLFLSFFIKNQGLFSAEFNSDLLRTLAFEISSPFELGGACIFTSFFVHFSFTHLLTNYAFLLPAGIYLENKFGSRRYIVFLILSHVFVLFAQVAMKELDIYVGASNAIEAAFSGSPRFLLGASAVAFSVTAMALLKAKIYVVYVLVMAVYAYLVFTDQSNLVSHVSHILGWAFGSVAYLNLRSK